MAKEGKDTTEWKAQKWIMYVAGLVGMIATSLAAALPASGAVEADSAVVVVLGVVATVGVAVGGGTASQYYKARTEQKKLPE